MPHVYTNRELAIDLSSRSLAEVLELLRGPKAAPNKRGRTPKQQAKIARLKAIAGEHDFILTREPSGYMLTHAGTGLASRFDKYGNPKSKHDCKWVKTLNVIFMNGKFLVDGIEIPVTEFYHI